MIPLLVVFLLSVCNANYQYSRTYQSGNALPLTELENFVASLPNSGVQSIRVRGSDGSDFTCATPSTAQSIVSTWKQFGTYPNGANTYSCGGQIWYTSGCCGNTLEIGGPFACSCTQKWSIRSGAGCSWGTNWGGTSCPGRGPLTMTIDVVTCGPTFQSTDLCNGGEGCSQCNCIAGYEPFTPTRPACKVIDMCNRYGYSGQNVNFIASCLNGQPNQRIITCKVGYYVVGYPQTQGSITLTGATAFSGCTQIDMCGLYGFSGNNANTANPGCTNSGVNQRTITCNPGYYAVSPSTPSITLTGDAKFLGCSVINNCDVYGDNGRSQFVQGCTNGVNTRTITCKPGYAAQGQTTNPAITLTGNAQFTGCSLIDTCRVYGTNTKPQHVLDCKSGINQRTITCEEGYFPVGTTENIDSDSITLIGNAEFTGCQESNLCTLVGFSGKDEPGSLSCTPGANQRTLTCKPGYHAKGSSPNTNPTITLVGERTPFQGCELIDNCAIYGYNSGGQSNTQGCTNGVNTRTITCKAGYRITGSSLTVVPPTTSITLTAGASFPGCSLIDNCALYGNSSKPAHVISCVNGENKRNITCAYGYYAVDGSTQYNNAIPWISLIGNAPFKGCEVVPTCVLYGYSKNGQNAKSCEQTSPNVRLITCNTGYYAISPSTPSISLTGNAEFKGCTQIDNCAVYGNGGLNTGYAKCTNGVNQRTITCQVGYHAVAPATRDITLIGSEKFKGCTQIDMCAVYGYKEKPSEVFGCVNAGVNKRTIICNPHYAIVTISGGNGKRIEDYQPNVTIEGPTTFQGCTPWCGDNFKLPEEDCEDGNTEEEDGCDGFCKVEPGWICSRTTPGACCKVQKGNTLVKSQGLVCKNGHFAPATPGTPLIITGPTQTITENMSFCGDMVIGYADSRVAKIDIEFRNANLALAPGVVLTIAGTLTVEQTGVVGFTPGSNIQIVPNCDPEVTYDEKKQLHCEPSGLFQVIRDIPSGDPDLYLTPVENDETTPFGTTVGPFLNLSGCGTFSQFSFYTSTEGGFSQGDFTFLISKCGEVPLATDQSGQPLPILSQYDYYLNTSCPSFNAWADGNNVLVGIHLPVLCTPALIGVIIGSIVGGLLLLALLALLASFLFSAPAGAAGEGGGYIAM